MVLARVGRRRCNEVHDMAIPLPRHDTGLRPVRVMKAAERRDRKKKNGPRRNEWGQERQERTERRKEGKKGRGKEGRTEATKNTNERQRDGSTNNAIDIIHPPKKFQKKTSLGVQPSLKDDTASTWLRHA